MEEGADERNGCKHSLAMVAKGVFNSALKPDHLGKKERGEATQRFDVCRGWDALHCKIRLS